MPEMFNLGKVRKSYYDVIGRDCLVVLSARCFRQVRISRGGVL